MENKITKAWIRNHFQYSWWKYLAALIISIFGINLIFSMTAYRPPEEKKLEIYLCSGYADAQMMEEAIWPKILEVCPDQEELTVLNIDISTDDYYTQMQFTTYIAAQQGDILLMTTEKMAQLSQEGADYAFLDLTPYIESGALDVGELDLSSMVFKSEMGAEGIYGIPADALYGLLDYGIIPYDTVLCVTCYNGNEENVIRVLQLMLDLYGGEKPDWYHPENIGKQNSKSETQMFY